MSMSWHSGTAFDPQSTSLVSPQQTSPIAPSPTIESGRKRKRSSSRAENGDADGGDGGGGFAGSPASQANGKQRHQPGVKRACNDCRQQKVSQFVNRLINQGRAQVVRRRAIAINLSMTRFQPQKFEPCNTSDHERSLLHSPSYPLC